MSEFALAFAADEKFEQGLAVAMHTALANLPWRPEVVVVDNGLSDAFREWAERVVGQVRWITPPQARLAALACNERLGAAAYSLLVLPELIPDVRRIVFLDADVLVRGDLSPLFTFDLNGAAVAAVRNFVWSGLPHVWYNTGVLAIDVARWRAGRLTERSLDYAITERPPNGDQDALNAVIDDWCDLGYRWNVQRGDLFAAVLPLQPVPARFRRWWLLTRTARVLHFTGPLKPWQGWQWRSYADPVWMSAAVRAGYFAPRDVPRWLMTLFAHPSGRGSP